MTSLNNFATPIIRYQINDYAEAGGSCDCGRGYPVVNKILGRHRNMFVAPSGGRYYPIYTDAISELAREMKVINQVQLLQTSITEVTVRMVVTRKLDMEQEARVKAVLGAALSGFYELDIQYFDEIPRTSDWKFEDAICMVTD